MLQHKKGRALQRLWILLLIGLLCLSLMPAVSFAAETSGACGDNLTWSFSGGKLSISGTGAMSNFSDTTLAPWYQWHEEIISVELPEGLTSIGRVAFFECTQLRAVTIPSTVTSIGKYAFAGCTSLCSAPLPNGLETLGEAAFRDCRSLAGLRIPESLKNIGSQAFYRCYGLSAVTIPASVTKMGSQVFAYCTGLIRATVNTQMEVLPDWTFYGCTNLSTVVLSETIVSTGDSSFAGCDSLSEAYTQSYDFEVADKIDQEISQTNPEFDENGYVANYDAPPSTTTTKREDSTVTTVTVTETENAVVTSTTSFDVNSDQQDTSISAVVENSDGWEEVRDAIQGEPSHISVQIAGNQVKGEDLTRLAKLNANIELTTDEGVTWNIPAADLSEKKHTGTYDLGVKVSELTDSPIGVQGDATYRVVFAGAVDFNASVALRLPTNAKEQLATLYQKDGEAVPLQTALVDRDGNAWFHLANVDPNTEYYVVLNSAGVTRDEAIIPDSLKPNYDIDASLTDSNGVQYVITGRKSSWGMDLKTVFIILGGVMFAAFVVIGVVMTLINRRKQLRLQYQEADDEPINEDELRMQVMREMLEEQKKQNSKK